MRLVVYCTAAERRVLRCSGGRLRPEAAFPADADGLTAFQDYLRVRSGAVATLVIDVPGEEFHEEQIPLLRGRDRETVVERRLAQRFPQARLAVALSLGRAEAARRKERLLLASYADAHPFAPWLDALCASRVRLAGVYSSALLVPAFALPEVRHAPLCMVASVHAQGLRVCFLEQGRLRFARFENARAATADEYAARAHAEISRLADYLATLRALPAQALPLIVIAHAAQRNAFERALASDARFALRFEPLDAMARRLGVRAAPPELGAEQLALVRAVTRPPREQFARGSDRVAILRWRLQRALAVAGALGFAACAAYAGVQGLEALELRDAATALRLEALQARQRYERMAAAFPATPASAENIRLTVQELRRIAARTASPEPALARVATALEQCPQVALDALKWNVGPPVVPDSSASSGLAQTVEITARVIAAKRSDVRAVDAEIQRFAALLEAGSGWQVVRSQPPFDTTVQGTLKGGGEAAPGGEAPRFVLVIARPLR
ncbi:MAG: hypothetical protein EPO27_18025 [Betaproteobacteria bacterium]|nr:MAG: hypothetical protein EPO27_18025 [Betaproteobacteria bacterium]